MYAASAPLYRVLSGTSNAPAPTEPSAAITHSAQFGAHIATRSPRSMPLASTARVAAATSSANWSKVSRVVVPPGPWASTNASDSPNRAAASSTKPGMVPHWRSPRGSALSDTPSGSCIDPGGLQNAFRTPPVDVTAMIDPQTMNGRGGVVDFIQNSVQTAPSTEDPGELAL